MSEELVFLLIAFGIPLYFLPSIIAYRREHPYIRIIFALNLFGGITVVLWILAFIWTFYPFEQSLSDPPIWNLTGTGLRRGTDTVRPAGLGPRGVTDTEARITTEIRDAADLLSHKLISEAEYQAIKGKILQNV